MSAVYNGRLIAIETLVVFGADIDAVNGFADSVLICAVQNGHSNTVRLLLALNADATKTNQKGKAAHQCATRDEMKQVFLAHESKTVKICFSNNHEF